jgi:hypothetical protein
MRVTETPPVLEMTWGTSIVNGWTHLGSTESMWMIRFAVPSVIKKSPPKHNRKKDRCILREQYMGPLFQLAARFV